MHAPPALTAYTYMPPELHPTPVPYSDVQVPLPPTLMLLRCQGHLAMLQLPLPFTCAKQSELKLTTSQCLTTTPLVAKTPVTAAPTRKSLTQGKLRLPERLIPQPPKVRLRRRRRATTRVVTTRDASARASSPRVPSFCLRTGPAMAG